ncbi:stigma-specific STIG1-like protein 1 [Nymphaea colorata]|uniref:Stigma-specific STIG1-like protein 1 n=1 Tax=Nymphaea colorata TaxID=210225 RepID=A0A5K1EMS9_9MAGN|nr:stigma-specific STIG1-like protein 1 [Nymphaea colorata]VVW53881.1 unnamed protein product [Nymphaea colorata]
MRPSVLALMICLAIGTLTAAHTTRELSTHTLDARPSEFLARSVGEAWSCNSWPGTCRLLRGSAGPDCCHGACVSMQRDARHCGVCGKKCRHLEACCHGKCVNLMFDAHHCGSCNKKCKSGARCSYGMCDYA